MKANCIQTQVIVSKYIDMIEFFVSGAITTSEFEKRYLTTLKNEDMLPEQIFFPLDELFAAVDAYWPDESTRDSFDIGEEQLLDKARSVLDQLKIRRGI